MAKNNRFDSFKVETRPARHPAPKGAFDFEELAVSLKRYPDTNRTRLLMELDRPANLFGSRAVGARWSGLAQRDGSPGPSSAGPTDDRRLGIRCHDGRKKHLPVRLNVPSGLLYESPGGDTRLGQTGGNHR